MCIKFSSAFLTRLCLALALVFLAFSAQSSLAQGAQVDLSVKSPALSIAPGSTGTRVFTVTNEGQSTTATVQLTFATPEFINIDTSQGLPSNCSFIYLNNDPLVPSVVRCTIAGVPSGQSVSVSIPVVAASSAPSGEHYSRVVVLPTSSDVDTDLNNNMIGYVADIEHSSGFTFSGNVNLYVVADEPALDTTGTANPVTIEVGNNGPSATTGQVILTAATTFFENFVSSSLPAGCSFLLEDSDPSVPEIVQCSVSAGLAPGTSQAFYFQINIVPGGPQGLAGALFGSAETTVPNDVDPDLSDNAFNGTNTLFTPTTQETTHPTITLPSGTVTGGPPFVPPATTGTGAAVDLDINASAVAVLPGQDVPVTFTIGNHGQSATGQVRLIFQTPIFVNADSTQMPSNCAFLYENADFIIPSVVQCLLNGPASGQTVSQTLQLITASNIPEQRTFGRATVMPAYSSPDVEQSLGDNEIGLVFNILKSGIPVGSKNLVSLVLAKGVAADLLTDRPGTSTFLVSNHGSVATQGNTLFTYITPPLENIDSTRPLPAGCSFLYENADPVVPSIVQCVIAASIPVGAQVASPIPLTMPPATLFGILAGFATAVPQNPNLDIDPDLTTNYFSHETMLSRLPPHNLTFYLHSTDIPGTAGGYTMNQTAPTSTSTVSLSVGSSQSWFSDPALVGTFEPGATFTFQMPCTLGLSVGGTYTLSSAGLDGSNTRTLGTVTQPLSLCLLGSHTVSIPVLTPQSLDERRLELTITNTLSLNLNLRTGSGTFLGTSLYEGTP